MPKPHPVLGEGDSDQRLRSLEMLVSDHEGDLTQAAKDTDALFLRTSRASREHASIKVTIGQHEVLLRGLTNDVEDLAGTLKDLNAKMDKGFSDVRTSFRTVALAVGAAAIAFAGLAVTIATQVPH